jgi:uncharacterized protein YjeT (DUF2065 family)
MTWFLYLFSCFNIAAGALYILYTDACRQVLALLLGGTYRILVPVTAIAVGILLIAASFYSAMTGFILALGALVLAKGILLALNPGKVFEDLRGWYLHRASDQTYRFFGIIMLIIGIVILSWI